MDNNYPILTQLLKELVSSKNIKVSANIKHKVTNDNQETKDNQKDNKETKEDSQETKEDSQETKETKKNIHDIEQYIKETNNNTQLPMRYIIGVSKIASDMGIKMNDYPMKTLRACGKFVKDNYVKRYKRNPLQLQNNACLYTNDEIKFVQSMIRKYFKKF